MAVRNFLAKYQFKNVQMNDYFDILQDENQNKSLEKWK
jgi:hypothetical protein